MLKVHDFRCKECDFAFEELVTNEEEPRCPLCDGEVTRLISAPHLDYNGFWLQGMESGERYGKMRKAHQKRQARAKQEHGTYSPGGQSNRWDKAPEDFI